ncbi:MAG: sugar transferase [Planctomycetaceae bacterium]
MTIALLLPPQMHAKAQPFQPRLQWYLPVKFMAEYVVAFVLLVITAPIILIAAAIVRLTSPGPAFFSQTRVGKDQKEFTIIKLRTMVHKAEVLTGPVWSKPNDCRVTRVGAFLRDTHIDEFPQLFNILRGEMSLIGPRPERPEFVSTLQHQIANYLDRSNVRPGITGLAQLKLPPDYHIDDVKHKLAFDLYYVETVSPGLDARICLFTALRLFSEVAKCGFKAIQLPTKETVDRLYHSRNVEEFDEPIFEEFDEQSIEDSDLCSY